MKKIIIAITAILGLVTVAPSISAEAAVSSCNRFVVDGGRGAASHCNFGDSNDRHRIVLVCTNNFTYRGPTARAGYYSYKYCPTGHSRVASYIEACNNYVYVSTGGYWTCSSGWYVHDA